MFWGLCMEPHKRYTQTVAEGFHISQAALDVSNNDGTPTQIFLEFENNSYLLSTLSKEAKLYQVPLDLNFQKGDHISFRTVGPGTIHLSGYFVIDDEDDDLAARLMGEDDSEEEMMEAEADTDTSVTHSGKRKMASAPNKNKKGKFESPESSDEDESESFGSMGDSTMQELLDIEAEESDDVEDDDDFDEGDSEEELGESDQDDSDAEDDSDEEEESPKMPVANGKTKKAKEETPKSAKKSKKELNHSQQATPINQSQQATPKSEKGKKGEKTPKSEKKTPKADGKTPQKEGKTPKQEKKTPNGAVQSPQKKVLEGGVISEDLKTGEGPVAKAGKMVQVYYVGRLKANNKQFDATKGGPGFKFRLGRSEVIRGWDVGVQGMRVGGKRRLTIPAPLAYGSKGSPPIIPPNSTLVFEVELRGVS